MNVVKGRDPLHRLLGLMHGRVVANGFNYAGQHLLQLTDRLPERASHFEYHNLHEAHHQAQDIQALPMLAEALLSSQPLPWQDHTAAQQNAPPPGQRTKLRFALANLHLTYPTGLLPTAPKTMSDRYVQTVPEAELALLALRVGEPGVAREIVEFYWEKSQAGQQLLHESYDALAGTAMALDVRFRRPIHARRSAEAQLAVADAAFAVGFLINEPRYLTFGKNLVRQTLSSFRPTQSTTNAPRGIADAEYKAVGEGLGLSFWPEPESYSLRCNARVPPKRLSEVVPRHLAEAPGP